MDGRCKTFEAAADGYGRGEAFAMVCIGPSGSSAQPLATIQVRVPLVCNHPSFAEM